MEQANNKLSAYATVGVDSDHQDANLMVSFKKKPYGKLPITTNLTITEWEGLVTFMPTLKATAKDMWDAIQRGENPNLRSLHRILSNEYAVMLNAFETQSDGIYVTISIRHHFNDKDGQFRLKKEGGITLNYEELVKLTELVETINADIATRLTHTKTITIKGIEEVLSAQKLVEDFWKMGGSKCRLLLCRESPSTLVTL